MAVLYPISCKTVSQYLDTQPEAGSGMGRLVSQMASSCFRLQTMLNQPQKERALEVRAAEPAKGATMKLHRNESGQMLIMTAIELVLLLGFLALAADVGVLFHTKRQMQTAVDAAATAAALNNYNAGLATGASDMTNAAAACYAIVANGYATSSTCSNTMTPGTYTDATTNVQFTINDPPSKTDSYHTAAGYVEVIMSKPDPLYFFKAFTGNNTATVAVRAVAGDPVGAQGCIWVNQLAIKGSASISGPNGTNACGIYVSNNTTKAVNNNDQATTIQANFVYTLGTYSKFNTSPTPTQTIAPNQLPPAPFQDTYTPTPTTQDGNGNQLCSAPAYAGTSTAPSSGNTYGLTTFGLTNTLPSPTNFYYPSGTSYPLNVYCFSQNVTINAGTSSINMPTGMYVFLNGATITGQVTFGEQDVLGPQLTTGLDTTGCYSPTQTQVNSGSWPWSTYGAVVYNYGGTLFTKNGQLGICSQSGGPYDAIAIAQPPINSNPLFLQFGMSGKLATSCSVQNAALNGYIWAPTADVELQDNGGGLLVTGIVAAAIGNPDNNPSGFANTSLIACDYNSVNNSTTPLRQIALVE